MNNTNKTSKTKTTHTPGPWTVNRKAQGRAAGIEGSPMTARPIAQWIYNPADAALIAAAPDLLEAARGMVSAWADFCTEEGGENGGLNLPAAQIPRLLAAIAKAEGR